MVRCACQHFFSPPGNKIFRHYDNLDFRQNLVPNEFLLHLDTQFFNNLTQSFFYFLIN